MDKMDKNQANIIHSKIWANRIVKDYEKRGDSNAE